MKLNIDNLYPGLALNPKLVQKVVEENPVWNDIFSQFWEIANTVDLQKFASFLRQFFNDEIQDMHTWWFLNSGKPMSLEEERKVFTEPKIYAHLSFASKFIKYLELTAEMQDLTESMGMEKFGPIANNKNCRAARNGGKKRAENMKFAKLTLRKEYKVLYDMYEKRSPNLSANQIYIKIAEIKECSPSHVQKVINDYQPPKKK